MTLLALATEYLRPVKSLELHSPAVLPLAFILAKVKGGAAVASSGIDHLNR